MTFPDISTHDGRRGSVVPPVLWATLWRGFNVRPSLTATRSVNGSPRNTIHGCQFGAAKVAFANIAHLIVRQFAAVARLTQRLCAVSLFISVVFLGSGPAQAVKAIVGWVAVIVRTLMNWRRRGADKNCQNNTVQQMVLHLAADQELDPVVTKFSYRLAFPQPRKPIPRSSNVCTKPAHATDGVSVRPRDWFPNLARKCINAVSHAAPLLRSWLGPRGVSSTVSGPFFLAKTDIIGKGDGHALSVD